MLCNHRTSISCPGRHFYDCEVETRRQNLLRQSLSGRSAAVLAVVVVERSAAVTVVASPLPAAGIRAACY